MRVSPASPIHREFPRPSETSSLHKRRSASSKRCAVSAASRNACSFVALAAAALEAAMTPSHANSAVSNDAKWFETPTSSRARARHGSSLANAVVSSFSSSPKSPTKASLASDDRWSTALTRFSSSPISQHKEVRCGTTKSPCPWNATKTAFSGMAITPFARAAVCLGDIGSSDQTKTTVWCRPRGERISGVPDF